MSTPTLRALPSFVDPTSGVPTAFAIGMLDAPACNGLHRLKRRARERGRAPPPRRRNRQGLASGAAVGWFTPRTVNRPPERRRCVHQPGREISATAWRTALSPIRVAHARSPRGDVTRRRTGTRPKDPREALESGFPTCSLPTAITAPVWPNEPVYRRDGATSGDEWKTARAFDRWRP